MVQTMTDPLAGLWKQGGVPAIGAAAQGAVDAHESISEVPADGRMAGRQRRAADAFRQRNRVAAAAGIAETVGSLPIVVEEVAVAQVGDAGAANGGDARERRTVWRRVEQGMKPVTGAFQHRAFVRRAEEDERSQVFRPAVACLAGVVPGAAGQQTAATVADDRQFADLHRPCSDEGFEQRSERAAVGGDVQAAVVVQVDGRPSPVSGQGGAVIVSLTGPLQVVHTKAMDQHQQLAPGLRNRVSEMLPFQPQRPSAAVQAHLNRQRVLRSGQMIAEDAIENGQQSFPLGGRGFLARRGLYPGEQRADGGARQFGEGAYGSIHDSRGAGDEGLRRSGQEIPGDGPVHRLDHPNHARGGVGCEPAEPQHIGGLKKSWPGQRLDAMVHWLPMVRTLADEASRHRD